MLLTVSQSPHIHTSRSVSRCMWHVIIALLPALGCALYFFGIGALIVVVSSILGCMAFEYSINRWMLDRKSTLANGSAILTGMLLAFNLPSNAPVWMVIIGAFVAIGIGKMAFGGLGCNIWNPALVARVFLLISFPVYMTSWPLPEVNRMHYQDAVTGATTLSILKNPVEAATGASAHAASAEDTVNWVNLAVGDIGGSLGEISAIALFIGFLYLLFTKVITWHIPVAVLGTVALFTLCLGDNIAIELLSGGLLLGAFFMATDYVTSPMSKKGMLIYGIIIGAVTVVIRKWGAYPEGVSFAILLGNSVVPLIDRFVKPKKFGERRRKK